MTSWAGNADPKQAFRDQLGRQANPKQPFVKPVESNPPPVAGWSTAAGAVFTAGGEETLPGLLSGAEGTCVGVDDRLAGCPVLLELNSVLSVSLPSCRVSEAEESNTGCLQQHTAALCPAKCIFLACK